MPIGSQPVDPRLSDALKRIRAYMDAHGHQQKEVVEATGLSQPQVSKVLSGERRRVTNTVREICRYAGIDLDMAYESGGEGLPLSQTTRQLLEDNPTVAAVVARVVEALLPALLKVRESGPPPISKETS